MPRRLAAALAAACLLVAPATLAGKKEKDLPPRADRIFLKGHVWSGDPSTPGGATALAVRGPRILAIGSDLEIARYSGVGTVATDLKGGWVFPGFNDAHLHFLVLDSLDLAGLETVAEIQKAIGDYAKAHPEKEWIEGRGWGAGAFPGGAPDRKVLDAVVPDRPAFFSDRDHHTGWCNSKALELARITRTTPDPPHGAIVRDAAGDATGVLKEAARDLVEILIPPANAEERYQALKRGLAKAASYGLTSVQNASFDADNLKTYERVLEEGGLKVRMSFALPFKKDLSEEDLARYNALREKYTGPLVKFIAVKGFLDGVVDMQTAAMFEPYVGGGNIVPRWKQDELNATAAFYDRNGFQIQLHAVGDKAIDQALTAYEFVAKTNPERERRHRVEHAEVPRLADLARFKAAGVVASTQALFANPDKTTLENFAVLLGPSRASRADAFKIWDDAGVVQAFGSDYPVFSMEVLKGLYCAATRTTPQGTPPGGWYPENRISVEAALRHFTADAAYASFDEKEKGTLAVGKLADLVVLSENVLEPPAERLLRTKVLLTVLGGEDTFRAAEFGPDAVK